MTDKELFIKFCKMNKLMPFLMTKFYKKEPQLFKKYNGVYTQCKCNFDEYFKSKTRSGLKIIDLYYCIFNELTRWGTEANDDYRRCLRKWRYFVKNNVKYKTLKPGDKITYGCILDGVTQEDCTVKEIYPEYGTVSVFCPSENRNRTIYLGWVRNVNGKPFVVDYYIKYKNKTYGIN